MNRTFTTETRKHLPSPGFGTASRGRTLQTVLTTSHAGPMACRRISRIARMGLTTEYTEPTEFDRTMIANPFTLSVCSVYSVVNKVRGFDLCVSVPLWFKFVLVGAALARSSKRNPGPSKLGPYIPGESNRQS